MRDVEVLDNAECDRPVAGGEFLSGDSGGDHVRRTTPLGLDEVVLGLEGDSFFIASNAANFDALVPSVIGPAPLMDLKPPSAGLLVFGCGVALNGCCVGNEASIRP